MTAPPPSGSPVNLNREQDEDDRDDPREEDLGESDAEEGESDVPDEEWRPQRGALFHVIVWMLLILFALGILSMIATAIRRLA